MIFQYIETFTDSILANFVPSLLKSRIDEIVAILEAWFTLWIMARGYMVLAGKTEEPVKDLLWRLSIYGIILMFATNAGGWFTLVTESINNISAWAQGDVSLYKQLDDMMVDIIKMGNMMEDQDGRFEFTGFFAQVLVNMSFVIFSIPAIVIIIIAEFILKILIMIAPIMILTLLFDWIKTIFDNWLKMLLSSILTLLFVGIFFKIIALKYEAMVKQSLAFAKGGDIGIVSIAMDVFIVSLVVVVLILMARGIAQSLTYVAINSLPGSASRDGLNTYGGNGKSITQGYRERGKERKAQKLAEKRHRELLKKN